MEISEISAQLRALGLVSGDWVMVHSSFKSLGLRNPEVIIQALLTVLGDEGVLLMPGLSYLQKPPTIHNTVTTPTCVGFLSEYFRTRPGTVRSLNPTHSVCGVGQPVHDLFSRHILDSTPCGPNSPFNLNFQHGGKILMLGCGLRPNTTMHAIEEYIVPPYLFSGSMMYIITDAEGRTFQKEYMRHYFRDCEQRYDRVGQLLSSGELRTGRVGQAQAFLIDAAALFKKALQALQSDPFYFVDRA